MSESKKITSDALYRYLTNIKNEIDSVEAADANLETLKNNLSIIKFAMPFSMQKGKLLRELKKFPTENLSISDNPSELEVERAKKYFEEIIGLYEKFFHVLDKYVKKEEYSNATEKTSKKY